MNATIDLVRGLTQATINKRLAAGEPTETTPRRPTMEIVALDSFAAKEDLKARGYCFDRDAATQYDASNPVSGWVRSLPMATPPEIDAGLDELTWLEARGTIGPHKLVAALRQNAATLKRQMGAVVYS